MNQAVVSASNRQESQKHLMRTLSSDRFSWGNVQGIALSVISVAAICFMGWTTGSYFFSQKQLGEKTFSLPYMDLNTTMLLLKIVTVIGAAWGVTRYCQVPDQNFDSEIKLAELYSSLITKIKNDRSDVRLLSNPSTEEFLGQAFANNCPIGIKSEANDGFHASWLQAFVLGNVSLERMFWQHRNVQGSMEELGKFLHSYRQTQQQNNFARASVPCMKNFLGDRFATGQHDPMEAFDALLARSDVIESCRKNGLLSESRLTIYWKFPNSVDPKLVIEEVGPEFGLIEENGRYYTIQEDRAVFENLNITDEESKSLTALFNESIQRLGPKKQKIGTCSLIKEFVKPQWNPAPKHFILRLNRLNTVQGTDPLERIDESIEMPAEYFADELYHRYKLTSFIVDRHSEGPCGRYIAYVKRGDKFYECKDDQINNVSNEQFLELAKSGYVFQYSLV